eukprot:662958_1
MSALHESHEARDSIEMVGEQANNISSLFPITKAPSQYKLDINENEIVPSTVPHVPVPIQHDGDTDTRPNIVKRDDDNGDIVFFNRYILIRLLLTLLTLLMMFLCILYAIGQITTLNIQEFICANKPIEEIRQHSQIYNLPHGTTSGCWTSKGVKANQDLLFQNRAYRSQWIEKQSPQDIIKFSLFLCTALCLLFCLIYCQIFLFIQDVIRFQNRKTLIMKQRSTDFDPNSIGGPEDHSTRSQCCCCKQDAKNEKEDHKAPSRCGCCHKLMDAKIIKCIKRMHSGYKRHFEEDRPGWIVKHFTMESCEIVLQTLALFEYAGVQFRTGGNDNLAEEHQYVLLFGIVIAMNAIAVGFLWIFYVSWNQSCHGKSFHLSLLIVDAMFEMFYTFFPVILVWDYTANNGNVITNVGTFYTQSWLSFLRSFVPITLICVKILTASLTVVSKSRTIWKNEGFKRSDSIDSDQPDMINTAGMGANTIELQEKIKILFDDDVANVQLFINKASCCRLCVDDQPLLDHSYSHMEVRELRKELLDAHDTNDIEMVLSIYDRQQILRRCFIASFYIIERLYEGVSRVSRDSGLRV